MNSYDYTPLHKCKSQIFMFNVRGKTRHTRMYTSCNNLLLIYNRASSRTCAEPTQIGKYMIPAGTHIQMDLEAVHMDPEHWGPEDVKKCVPERYKN